MLLKSSLYNVAVRHIREIVVAQKEAFILDKDGGIDPYCDYKDEFDLSQVKEFLESDFPLVEVEDRLYGWYDHIHNDHVWEMKAEAKNKIIQATPEYAEDITEDILDEIDEDLQDYIYELVHLNIPIDHYGGKEINVVVKVANPTETIYPDDNGVLEDNNPLAWLAKQQGYSNKDLQEALAKSTDDPFLTSVAEEVQSLQGEEGNLVFLLRITLLELLALHTARKNKKDIVISSSGAFGLFNDESGAMGGLSIKAPNDIIIPASLEVEFDLDDLSESDYQIKICDILSSHDQIWANTKCKVLD